MEISVKTINNIFKDSKLSYTIENKDNAFYIAYKSNDNIKLYPHVLDIEKNNNGKYKLFLIKKYNLFDYFLLNEFDFFFDICLTFIAYPEAKENDPLKLWENNGLKENIKQEIYKYLKDKTKEIIKEERISVIDNEKHEFNTVILQDFNE